MDTDKRAVVFFSAFAALVFCRTLAMRSSAAIAASATHSAVIDNSNRVACCPARASVKRVCACAGRADGHATVDSQGDV